MASIFKPPKITQEQLSSTLLEYGEIVYNTTKNEFFTGNGTSGGITLFNEKPTTTSELINDSNFVTSSDVEESLSAYLPISGMNIYALKSDIPSGGESSSPTIEYNASIDTSLSGVYTLLKKEPKYLAGNFIFPTSENFINFRTEKLYFSFPKYVPSNHSAGMFSFQNTLNPYQAAFIFADPKEGIVIESHCYGSEGIGQLSISNGTNKIYIANLTMRDPNDNSNYNWKNISTSLNINSKQFGNYYAGYKLSTETAATLTLPWISEKARIWVKFIVDNSNAGSLLWGEKVLLEETETGKYLFEFLNFIDLNRIRKLEMVFN